MVSSTMIGGGSLPLPDRAASCPHGEEGGGQALVQREGPVERLHLSRDDLTIEHLEDRVGVKHAVDTLRRVDGQRLPFAQREQTRNDIDIAAGQHHTGDRTVTQPLARMQCGCVIDLLAQVRRGIEQIPPRSVTTDRDARLCPRVGSSISAPGAPAPVRVRIPLGKPPPALPPV